MKLKTTKIKNKDYVMVNERIKAFRTMSQYADYQLVTKIVQCDDEVCVMEAQVVDSRGIIIANGHARETRESSFINKTSHVENCETSAWGRALGNLGIGIDDSVATAEEVEMAIELQNIGEPTKDDVPKDWLDTDEYLSETESVNSKVPQCCGTDMRLSKYKSKDGKKYYCPQCKAKA
jgi:hypothetical protein